jgi:hypothetical protein
VNPLSEPDAMSHADAGARLRYVDGVRTRARRAVLLPSFGLLSILGIVLATRGVLRAVWPHAAIVSIAWIAGLVVARPALLRHWRGLERGAELRAGARLMLAYAAVGALALVLAIVAGVNPLITVIAAATALRARLAGMPAVALAAVATGALADALLESGVPAAAGEIVLGVALIVLGVALRAKERA